MLCKILECVKNYVFLIVQLQFVFLHPLSDFRDPFLDGSQCFCLRFEVIGFKNVYIFVCLPRRGVSQDYDA